MIFPDEKDIDKTVDDSNQNPQTVSSDQSADDIILQNPDSIDLPPKPLHQSGGRGG